MASPAARPGRTTDTGGTGRADGRFLFEGSNWTFGTMGRTYDAIEEIALNDLGLDVYPNQIEIISSEQMLDAYSSIGMPLMYQHWSFGKRFVREAQMYQKGYAGLAYEIVINSNPCISYNMEDSTMAMQALVMAHAAFGHNHFFKNNYLFQQWTDAEGILDYLEFAKRYVAKCEERYGTGAQVSGADLQRPLAHPAAQRRRRAAGAGRRRGRRADEASEAARGEPALFSGEEQPCPGALAKRNPAHRPEHRTVFLPAEADQGHERGLCHLRAPLHHEPALR
jgi:spore cortex formation protein SpoVR/YcgB (stage V sporulation)